MDGDHTITLQVTDANGSKADTATLTIHAPAGSLFRIR
jgi:hypothetical protein